MPGRKSTGPPPNTAPKSRRHKPKRALNALAVAEAENPQRLKIRQTRLGESDSLDKKRKRNEDDEESEFEGDLGFQRTRGSSKREKHENDDVDVESDSSGNEWTVGAVDKEDDSELDSDEAFGESDEERFQGFTFRGGKSSKETASRVTRGAKLGASSSSGLGKEYDLQENEEDASMEDGNLDLDADAVDLADVLDQQSNGTSKDGSLDAESNDEAVNESDDDVSSDAFEDEESALSISEDDDVSSNPSKLASLQALVSKMTGPKSSAYQAQGPMDAMQTAAPSEHGINSSHKLTIADLMPSITDPALRRSLKVMADNDTSSSKKRTGFAQKLDVPLPKRQQDRIDRTAAYEKSKETLGRWIDTVKQNRRADHLSFPLQYPDVTALEGSRTLLPSNRAKTVSKLESTIDSILQETGLASSKGEEKAVQAFEELKANEMPLAEVQARRAELRRTRDLLFREEIRAKRIKRIKSKSYRKVHRKERERNSQLEKEARVAAGIEDSESEKERNDRRRAEERMGARHRESRWAKGMKQTGRAKWDEDARDGVTEMARRGEELRMRMQGKTVGTGSDEGSESSDSAEEDDEEGGRRSQIAKNINALSHGGDDVSSHPLADMAFMKKAEMAKRARNDIELEDLRRQMTKGATKTRREYMGEEADDDEFEDNNESAEDEGQSEGEEQAGRRSYGPTTQSQPSRSSKKHMQNLQTQGRGEFEERQSPGSESGGEEAGEYESLRREEDDEVDAEIIVDTTHVDRANHRAQPSEPDNIHGNSQISKRKVTFANQLVTDAQPVAVTNNPWLVATNGTKSSRSKKSASYEDNADAIISNDITSTINNTTVSSFSGKNDRGPAPQLGQAAQRTVSTTTTFPPSLNEAAKATIKEKQMMKEATKAPDSSCQELSASANPELKSTSDIAAESDSDSDTNITPLQTNQALIRRAFASDSVLETFNAEKAAQTLSEGPQEAKSSALPGWGSWTGAGLSRRDIRHAKSVKSSNTPSSTSAEKVDGIVASKRQDHKLERVIINEKKSAKTGRKTGKYLASQLPHPFETRAQYERSLRIPVGPEWSTKEVFQGMTKPRVMVQRGVVISPMERPMA